MDYFLRYFKSWIKKLKDLPKKLKKILVEYHWQGKAREFQNAVEYAVNMESPPYISLKNLPERIKEVENSFTYTLDSSEKDRKGIMIVKNSKIWENNDREKDGR